MKAHIKPDGTPRIPKGYELSLSRNKRKRGVYYFVAPNGGRGAFWQTMNNGKSASQYVLVPKGKCARIAWVDRPRMGSWWEP